MARALAADPPLMLMDEPFGAIDPINRERLQDQFLSLQETLRKTVVFVTHDIDEAIKLGDRIAILRDGGHLAQYGTAAEVLSDPADEFVARFVGADRGLKRLSLTTVGELPLDEGTADVTRPADTDRARRAVADPHPRRRRHWPSRAPPAWSRSTRSRGCCARWAARPASR